MPPVDSAQGNCLALDIGGTKAEAAVVRPSGEILVRERVAVAEAGDHLFEDISSLVGSLQQRFAVATLGVACAGPMARGGEWVSPLNIPQWRKFPLASELARVTGLPTAVEGDVRALALAEGAFGAAKDLRNYASLVVSTGVGGALVLDGHLLDGDSGNGGHLGHVNVVPDGRQCSCGARGCLEAHASGWAIAEQTGASPAAASAEVRRETAVYVGRGIGTLASVLDFNHCFVAGSVALGFGDEFFATATATARSFATMHYSEELVITRSGLGDTGPLLGAALVGWRGAP